MRGVPEQTGLQVCLVIKFEFLLSMSKTVGRNHTSTLPRMQGSLLPCLPPIILHPRRELDPKCAPPPLLPSPPFPSLAYPSIMGAGARLTRKR